MAGPKGSIKCLLCKGAISVRSGNLDKFKNHIETDHDVFYEHDILVAINFLEDHEKEVIIEKVLPRIRHIFDNVPNYNGNVTVNHKLVIEKRLMEKNESDTNATAKIARFSDIVGYETNKVVDMDSEMDSSIELSDQSEDILNLEDRDPFNGLKVAENDSDNGSDVMGDDATLAESLQSIREIMNPQIGSEEEFTDCEICQQSVRKSIFEFHRKSHQSGAKATAECDICRKTMLRSSLPKHKRRCQIMNMNRDNSDEIEVAGNGSDHGDEVINNDAAKTDDMFDPSIPNMTNGEYCCYICKKPMLKGNIKRHIRMVHGPEMDIKCKICSSSFQKLDSLKWHTNKEHNLDLEDVEQMLSENIENSLKGIGNVQS